MTAIIPHQHRWQNQCEVDEYLISVRVHLLILKVLNQRYEQEIDCSTIVVVCQPTPLPKLGQSCVRL